MAKKKGHRRYTQKIPLAATAGVAMTVLGGQDEGGKTALSRIMAGEYELAIGNIGLNLTGYNIRTGEFNITKSNLLPMIIGSAVSWAATKFGLNRSLGTFIPIKI